MGDRKRGLALLIDDKRSRGQEADAKKDVKEDDAEDVTLDDVSGDLLAALKGGDVSGIKDALQAAFMLLKSPKEG